MTFRERWEKKSVSNLSSQHRSIQKLLKCLLSIHIIPSLSKFNSFWKSMEKNILTFWRDIKLNTSALKTRKLSWRSNAQMEKKLISFPPSQISNKYSSNHIQPLESSENTIRKEKLWVILKTSWSTSWNSWKSQETLMRARLVLFVGLTPESRKEFLMLDNLLQNMRSRRCFCSCPAQLNCRIG